MRGGEAASDSAFLANANAHYGNRSNPHPFFSRPRFGGSAFVVRHFAGDVTYCVDGFIRKNNDALHDDLRAMIQRCSAPFLKQLHVDIYSEEVNAHGTQKIKRRRHTPSGSQLNSRGKLTGTMTLGKKVRNEMKTLSSIIHAASPHFAMA